MSLYMLAKKYEYPCYLSVDINNPIAVMLGTMNHTQAHCEDDLAFIHTTIKDIKIILEGNRKLFFA